MDVDGAEWYDPIDETFIQWTTRPGMGKLHLAEQYNQINLIDGSVHI